MTDHDERWADVGKAIDARRESLGMTKAQLLRASGLSFKTLASYIDGEPIRRIDKARDLAAALRWPPDAIARLAAGERPEDLEPPPDPPAAGALDPDVIGLAARAGRLTPEQRAKVEGYIEALLDEST